MSADAVPTPSRSPERQVRLVLFDIDGTLIQTGGAGEKAFACVCEAEFGIANGAAQLQFAGRTDPSIVRDFFDRHAIETSPENFQRFFDRYVFYLDQLLGQLPGSVLPGVERWLQDLADMPRRPLVGLLTGNIQLGARLKLNHYGLWGHFRVGGFGDDDEDRNRVAAIARDRASRFLQQPLGGDDIMVIGDTPRDISCAKAIQARCVAVATGKFSVQDLEKHSPRWAVETLDQLSAIKVCG